MSQIPSGYQFKAFLSGVSALYGLFVVGCLTIFSIVSFVLPDGILKTVVSTASLLGFFALVGFGCYTIQKHPERFTIKEEHRIIIETRSVKTIEGEVKESITEPGPPTSLPKQKET